MESIDVITPALYAGPQIHCTFYVVVHSDFGKWLSSTFLPIRYPLTIMSFTAIHIPAKCSRRSAPKPLPHADLQVPSLSAPSVVDKMYHKWNLGLHTLTCVQIASYQTRPHNDLMTSSSYAVPGTPRYSGRNVKMTTHIYLSAFFNNARTIPPLHREKLCLVKCFV